MSSLTACPRGASRPPVQPISAISHWLKSTPTLISLAVLAATILFTGTANAAHLYHAREMNKSQFAALNKDKTVVMLVGGNFEEHGPYLPVDMDGIVAQAYANDLANALVAHGWNVLMFPEIALASSPVNELPAIYPYPGSYNLRFSTIRAVYMDLANEFGTAGYKWVFMIHTHGGPNFVRAQAEASAFFNSHFDGRMLRITGYGSGIESGPNPYATLSKKARAADAHSGHGGINETSLMLYIRPDLVDPDYQSAPSFPPDEAHGGMLGIAHQSNWLGYFGAPSYASAQYGAKLYRWTMNRYIQQALNVLSGQAPESNYQAKPERGPNKAALVRDAKIAQREQAWINQHGTQLPDD